MRCKIDENVPIEAAALLRAAGHDCHTVYDETLGGAPDRRVIARCRTEGRILLTLDLDFADIRAYPPGDYPGIVVFRPTEPDRERVTSAPSPDAAGVRTGVGKPAPVDC